MFSTIGYIIFVLAPAVLGAILLWRFPKYRRFRLRSILVYLVVMSLLVHGALRFVCYIASATVGLREVFVILWFAITWRLAWELWARFVGRLGQKWVRWARLRRHQGLHAPKLIRLIPIGRMLLTTFIFVPAFLSCVLTHRFKLKDDQDPESIYQMDFEHIRIPTADGLRLDGWFVPQSGASRTIVVCHGAGANKGNFVWFLGSLTRPDYNVVFFDFRAHGSSDGRTTTYGIRERRDVTAVVDWLKRERPAQSQVIVGLGSSQGSMALALAAAEDERIDAVILDSPFTSAYEFAQHHARQLPVIGPLFVNIILVGMSAQTGADFFHTSAVEAVSRLGSRPVMVIHGDDDIAMPVSHSQALYDAAAGPRELWFGPGPHSNIVTTDPRQYEQRVFALLDANLSEHSSQK